MLVLSQREPTQLEISETRLVTYTVEMLRLHIC